MKITVDTNVLVSATFWAGDSAEILDLVDKGLVELVLSKSIIKEFSEVLEYDEVQKKIVNKNLIMKRTVEKIIFMSTVVIPTRKVEIVKNDPDDNRVLECAAEGKVDYIISQDEDLLSLKSFEKIPIV